MDFWGTIPVQFSWIGNYLCHLEPSQNSKGHGCGMESGPRQTMEATTNYRHPVRSPPSLMSRKVLRMRRGKCSGKPFSGTEGAGESIQFWVDNGKVNSKRLDPGKSNSWEVELKKKKHVFPLMKQTQKFVHFGLNYMGVVFFQKMDENPMT